MTAEVDIALRIASDLVEVGVPIFVAQPDPTSATGYRLPQEWQRTDVTAARRALSLWRPGMALCAVMGHTLDLIDLDPRNGSPPPDFTAWPYAYATAATPSGGSHAFVAALRVGSRDGILPGVDVKGGRADGDGRGFAFIAPTVRKSKADGSLQPYVWTRAPDPHEVSQMVEQDTTGLALAGMISGARGGNGARPMANGARWNAPSTELVLFRPPTRAFTRKEAWRYCEPWLRQLSMAPDGQRNSTLNAAAKVFSHFGEEFWPTEWAWETLVGAVPPKESGVRMWDPRDTIGSAYRSARSDWRAELTEGARFPDPMNGGRPVELGGVIDIPGRLRDIGEWFDGTHEMLKPTRGMIRDDGVASLYAGKWHTIIGGTGSGKSWVGVAHAVEEMLGAPALNRPPGVVAYLHFEETSPEETASRLRSLGVERAVVVERFKWFDCADAWSPGEFAASLAALNPFPTLVILDGINAACNKHGQDPAQVQSVGWYRHTFVTPATRNGAAVLSLGHPPKARDRQDERHGYGSTAWLDEVDGVGFRLRPNREHPIRRGTNGNAQLYSTKDRPGGVEVSGRPHDVEGWVYVGSLCVDNATVPDGGTRVHLSAPQVVAPVDPIDALGQAVVELLRRLPGHRYESTRTLQDQLYEAGVKFDKSHLGPVLVRLENAGFMERDPEGGRTARAGWLSASGIDSRSGVDSESVESE